MKNLGRRDFLSFVFGAGVVASSKSYSFLGNILRPRNGDQITWNPSGNLEIIKKWWLFDPGNGNHIFGPFGEEHVLEVFGENLRGKVISTLEIDHRHPELAKLPIELIEGKTITQHVSEELYIPDGGTIKVTWPNPPYKLVFV